MSPAHLLRNHSETTERPLMWMIPSQTGTNCLICRDELLKPNQTQTAAVFTHKLAVSGRCQQPHLMHLRCAKALAEHSENTVKCQLCKREIGTVEQVKTCLSHYETISEETHHLTSTPGNEDETNDLDESQLRRSLQELRGKHKKVLPPDFLDTLKRAEGTSPQTKSMQMLLLEARVELSERYQRRIEEHKLPVDFQPALDLCVRLEADGMLCHDKKVTVWQAMLDNLKDEFKTLNPNDSRRRCEELRTEFSETSFEGLSKKLDELELIHLQRSIEKIAFNTDKPFSGPDPIKDLKKLQAKNLVDVTSTLKSAYLNKVRSALDVNTNTAACPLEDLLQTLETPEIQTSPECIKIKNTLAKKLLKKTEVALQPNKPQTYSVELFLEYAEYAAQHGSQEVQQKAQSLLKDKDRLIAEKKAAIEAAEAEISSRFSFW